MSQVVKYASVPKTVLEFADVRTTYSGIETIEFFGSAEETSASVTFIFPDNSKIILNINTTQAFMALYYTDTQGNRSLVKKWT